MSYLDGVKYRFTSNKKGKIVHGVRPQDYIAPSLAMVRQH